MKLPVATFLPLGEMAPNRFLFRVRSIEEDQSTNLSNFSQRIHLPFPSTLFYDSHRSHSNLLSHDSSQRTFDIPLELVQEPLQTDRFHSVIQTIDGIFPMSLYCVQAFL